MQKHYDNTNGSIYKFADDHGCNSYEFDMIKRIVRCRKKGQFLEDLQKTKDLIDLYIEEQLAYKNRYSYKVRKSHCGDWYVYEVWYEDELVVVSNAKLTKKKAKKYAKKWIKIASATTPHKSNQNT